MRSKNEILKAADSPGWMSTETRIMFNTKLILEVLLDIGDLLKIKDK